MSSRSYSQLYYHFVWATVGYQFIVEPENESNINKHITSKCKYYGAIPLAIGGTYNHLHLLIRTQPEIIPAEIIGKIKGESSHFINQNYSVKSHFSWEEGYGVCSVSLHYIDTIINYIRNQKKHHLEGSIIDEYEKITKDEFNSDSQYEAQMPDCVFGC